MSDSPSDFYPDPPDKCACGSDEIPTVVAKPGASPACLSSDNMPSAYWLMCPDCEGERED
jgi:hypothetical protein